VFVVLLAGAGYQLVGAPYHLALGPQSSAGAASTMADDADQDANKDANAHPVTSQQIQAMVDGLAARLKANPGDGDGWVMLARSYVALGKHAEAVGAFKRAQTLRPADADLLADYADALAMVNNGLQGEPLAMVERAIKLDPRNVKALSLAGTAAFDKKDYAGAVKMWERAAQAEPPGSAFGQQLRSGIAEARQLAGLPPSTIVTADAPPAAAAAFTTGSAQVAGTVTLAQGLATRVSPDDTVFIFARAVEGQRMPLAIVRKQVKDLPFKFTLDDSMSMSPEAKLSGFARVVVGARISKSGNAMPQPGDLQGVTPAVAVGANELRIEINQEVTRQ
jgi:cytochrome c-type biogenesis protein CcmH